MKLMIDLVPNHTSDQHPWYRASRERRDGKDDWYIWADGIVDNFGDSQPPNNWASVFSLPQLKKRQRGELDVAEGELTPPLPAWSWDGAREQYYLHSFADFQPDLNWNNPDVRDAAKSTIRTWLDRGVDGFRVDAVNYVGKKFSYDGQGRFHGSNEEYNTAYTDGQDNPYDQLVRHNSCGYPGTLHPYLREIISVLDESKYSKRQARIVFEAYMQEHQLKEIDELSPGKAAAFNFTPIDSEWHMPTPVRKQILDKYHERVRAAGNIGNSVMGNHDKSRVVTRVGEQSARTWAMYSFLQPGMMFVYNGEELGRHDYTKIPEEMIRDPNGLRDPERTPMPWSSNKPNMGFSDADPKELYLPMNPNDKPVDVQHTDMDSFLSYYQRLTALKHQLLEPYVPLDVLTVGGKNNGVIAYGRGETHTIITNFTDESQKLEAMSPTRQIGRVILSSLVTVDDGIMRNVDTITLQPNEAIVIAHQD